MPKVAVITPTYNRASGLLQKAMLSVSGQSYADFAHVIVDDGSTDSTAEVVRAFPDKRVLYTRKERTPDQKFGASAARNHGVRMVLSEPYFSDTKYITFLDSDDMLHRDSLGKKVHEFEADHRVRLVYSHAGICDNSMRLLCSLKGPETEEPKDMADLLIRMPCIQFLNLTVMLEKDLMQELCEDGYAYDERLGYGEDRDFSIRALQILEEGQMRSVPEILNFFRKTPASVSHLYIRNGWYKDDKKYLARKHSRAGRDELVEILYRLATHPQSFLPEAAKRPLRQIRDDIRARYNGIADPFIEAIEMHSF